MKVIVDTSIWSLAFRRRRNPDNHHVEMLRELITDGRVVLLGVVRQEMLSGIKHVQQFERLKNDLRAFPDLALEQEDYEVAAGYFNICRRKGVQGANTDFLICASAARRDYEILTTDNDFDGFSQHLPITLMEQYRGIPT